MVKSLVPIPVKPTSQIISFYILLFFTGKLLLFGVVFDCLDATLTMAAYMSHKTPFIAPLKKKRELTERKKYLSKAYSDQITIFRIYRV